VLATSKSGKLLLRRDQRDIGDWMFVIDEGHSRSLPILPLSGGRYSRWRTYAQGDLPAPVRERPVPSDVSPVI